jgi:hypothetical protein
MTVLRTEQCANKSIWHRCSGLWSSPAHWTWARHGGGGNDLRTMFSISRRHRYRSYGFVKTKRSKIQDSGFIPKDSGFTIQELNEFMDLVS